MIIGVLVMEFSIPENVSLKGKRAVVRSAVERASRRFNAAVAEVDAHDTLGRAVVSAAVISTSRAHAARMLDEIDRFLSRDGRWSPAVKRTEFSAIGTSRQSSSSDDLRWADFEDEDEP